MLPFSETLLLWRLERSLSQEALAQRAEISRPNLSAIERGKREVSLTTLRSLALALGVRPGVLVDGIGPGSQQSRLFPRQALERIADAVWKGTSLPSDEEKRLADLLRPLLHPRKNLSRGKRFRERTWLQLKSTCPPELIQVLIEKVRDREQAHGSKTN